MLKKKVPHPADDEITIERLVRPPAAASEDETSTRQTREMPVIDARLLAIARGDTEPDEEEIDPFGGLIPVEDDDG